MVSLPLSCSVWRVENDLVRVHLMCRLAMESDSIQNRFEVAFEKLSEKCNFI